MRDRLRQMRVMGSDAHVQLRPVEKSVARRGRGQLLEVAIGHGGQDLDGAVALFDGDAELHAFDQAAQARWRIALFSADQAFGNNA